MPFLVDKNHKKAKRFPNTLKESQKNCSIFATYATQIILHKIKTCTSFDLIQFITLTSLWLKLDSTKNWRSNIKKCSIVIVYSWCCIKQLRLTEQHKWILHLVQWMKVKPPQSVSLHLDRDVFESKTGQCSLGWAADSRCNWKQLRIDVKQKCWPHFVQNACVNPPHFNLHLDREFLSSNLSQWLSLSKISGSVVVCCRFSMNFPNIKCRSWAMVPYLNKK